MRSLFDIRDGDPIPYGETFRVPGSGRMVRFEEQSEQALVDHLWLLERDGTPSASTKRFREMVANDPVSEAGNIYVAMAALKA